MSPRLSQRFRKIFSFIFPLILGAALGVGGTLGVQTYILPESEPQKASQREEGALVPIGEFTVNLQGSAYLRTELVVEGVSKKDQEYLRQRETFLKDRVNTVLANKSIAEIASAEEREKLRNELIVELNKVADNRIRNVLFLSFVYQ